MNNEKNINEAPQPSYLQGDVVRSASDFKAEVIRTLTAFYEYGDKYGYSNIELSRIRSCITKVEKIPAQH